MAIICPECKTENRAVAKFCIHCITTLPTAHGEDDFAPTVRARALFALSGGRIGKSSTSVPSRAESGASAQTRFSQGLWVSVAALTVALFVGAAGWLVAGAGGWYLYSAGKAQVDPPLSAQAFSTANGAQTHAPVGVVTSHSASATLPPPAVSDAIHGNAEGIPDSPRSKTESGRTGRGASTSQTLPSIPADSQASAAPATVRRMTRNDPRMLCSGRNFVAEAQCMAEQCVKPEFRNHTQCEVVRQRQRLEEAKRNPVAP